MYRLLLDGLAPFYSPDNAGGSTPPPADPPAADPAPEADPPAGDPPAADPPADPPADDDGDSAELSAADWQEEAGRRGKEAAKYRTQRNKAREDLAAAQSRIADLEAQAAASSANPATPDPVQQSETRAAEADRRAAIAELAAEHAIPMKAIQAFRQLESATDDAGRQAAIEALRAHLQPTSAGSHRPPADHGSAPSLNDQIRAAERAGNHKLALQLKAQKIPLPQ